MSTRIYGSIDLPQGHRAHPPTITAAIGNALVELEDKVKQRGLRPVWDTLELSIENEEHFEDDITFGGAVERTGYRVTTGSASVLAVDPKEVR